MNKEKILLALAIIASVALAFYCGSKYSDNDVKELSEADLANVEEIRKQLDVTKQEAEELKKEISEAKGKPNVTYYVQAPTVEQAADAVKQDIIDKSPNIPDAAKEDTDKTVVVPTAQTVDVYKINLRNNHKIKGGISYIDNHAYLSAGYQAGRVEGILHFDESGITGASVMYTIKEW